MAARGCRRERRLGATCAIAGSVLLFVGTYLHPMPADPDDALAAFTEYAADRMWVTSHLTQLTGVTLGVIALVILAQRLAGPRRAGWSLVAGGGAIASLSVASVLQAVDGIALKRLVDIWAAAPAAQKEAAFHAAFAVRQVEVGLASLLSILLGATVCVYGLSLLADHTYPRWVGALAVAGGLPTMVAGLVMAYTGFSARAMAISMPASGVLLAWLLALGVFLWRQPDDSPEPPPA
jgi:hypothetical protein